MLPFDPLTLKGGGKLRTFRTQKELLESICEGEKNFESSYMNFQNPRARSAREKFFLRGGITKKAVGINKKKLENFQPPSMS